MGSDLSWDIVSACEFVAAICAIPRNLEHDHELGRIIHAARPKVLPTYVDAVTTAEALRGWSRGEARRRNVSVAGPFLTTDPTTMWGVFRAGKKDHEPFLVDVQAVSDDEYLETHAS